MLHDLGLGARRLVDVTAPASRGIGRNGIRVHDAATLIADDVERVDSSVVQEHEAGSTLTRNELEEAFLLICRRNDRPPDAVNAWIALHDGGGAEADFLWRAQRLVVEVDGRDVHTTRRAFESDRRRDQRLTMLGYRVVRFTWRQVMLQPHDVSTTLRGLV